MERVFAGFDQEVGEEDEAWRGVNLGTYGTGDQTPPGDGSLEWKKDIK